MELGRRCPSPGRGGTGLLDSYEPERRPGARLPHAWLPDGILDGVRGAV
ncbi:hypothetical protein ABZ806_30100 [Spirillospora sp. NPDC047418]